MNAATVAALRELLGRARAAGWKRSSIKRVNGVRLMHKWLRDGVAVYVNGDQLQILGRSTKDDWLAPILSVAVVTDVLEMAGALPPTRLPRPPAWAMRAAREHLRGMFPPPPVLSTITDDERVDHPQPGDEPSEQLPAGVVGWPVRRFNVDPKSYQLPDTP